MSDHLLPEFAFQHAGHDRIADRRDDAEFLETAWADPTSKVVVVRDPAKTAENSPAKRPS